MIHALLCSKKTSQAKSRLGYSAVGWWRQRGKAGHGLEGKLELGGTIQKDPMCVFFIVPLKIESNWVRVQENVSLT